MIRFNGAVLIFFWDYDTQWGADRSRSLGGPKKWGFLDFENTDRLLELHDEYNIPACFAIVGAAALAGERPYHDPQQIRRIHEAGHEIASHSFKHEWLPGLKQKELLETLKKSKDALEQCIGHKVVSFVPPYNQPFDYLRGYSISFSERYHTKFQNVDLFRLCQYLKETGYLFSRVSYKSLPIKIIELLLNKNIYQYGYFENIAGLTCARLNTPAGFNKVTQNILLNNIKKKKVVLLYGHPHSLYMENSQNENNLISIFKLINYYRHKKLLKIYLPQEIITDID